MNDLEIAVLALKNGLISESEARFVALSLLGIDLQVTEPPYFDAEGNEEKQS